MTADQDGNSEQDISNIAFSSPQAGVLQLELSGDWLSPRRMPSYDMMRSHVSQFPQAKIVSFDTQHLRRWDSILLTFLIKLVRLCEEKKLKIKYSGLPSSVVRLLRLALAVPEQKDVRQSSAPTPFVESIGNLTLSYIQKATHFSAFLGDIVLTLPRFFKGQACYLPRDFLLFIQESGVAALGIVSLISFLIGIILAFIGAVQLQQFGAEIYVANLVSVGMTRELAPLMTAIIMTGRTGAAYAANIGTMQVNEEVDALVTSVIPPMEFLVLPRLLALILMMPLLCLYSDVLGIIGGATISAGMLHISLVTYFNQVVQSITLTDVWIGLIKAGIFGALVAVSGCFQGMICGRSASAVGKATTNAVVVGIIAIILADAVISIVTQALGV